MWQENSKIIIMVANLRERNRDQCVKYWPDEEEPPLIADNLEIRLIDSIYYANYTVREFEIQPLRSGVNGGFKNEEGSLISPLTNGMMASSVFSIHSRSSIIENR